MASTIPSYLRHIALVLALGGPLFVAPAAGQDSAPPGDGEAPGPSEAAADDADLSEATEPVATSVSSEATSSESSSDTAEPIQAEPTSDTPESNQTQSEQLDPESSQVGQLASEEPASDQDLILLDATQSTVREGRYPPPEFAFVVFVPTFTVYDGTTPNSEVGEVDGQPSDRAEDLAGDAVLIAEDDLDELDPRLDLNGASRWLSEGLSNRLHELQRYHVVELQDLPLISYKSATEIWDDCTDRLGCMTLLGDRAQARISLAAEVRPPEGESLPVTVRIYDLDWGEEVGGLELMLPWIPEATPEPEAVELDPLAEEGSSEVIDAEEGAETPTPVEAASEPGSAWPEEALDALTMAVDVRLMPLALTGADPVDSVEASTPTPKPVEDQAERDAELESQLDGLAAKANEGDSVGSRYERNKEKGLDLDEDEQEMLGMTTDQYIRFKRGGWTEAEWRERNSGRTGHFAVRVGGGAAIGEMAQLYDGVLLLGDVATEVVEKYARLVPTAGAGYVGQLGVALGISPDLEVELRGGYSKSLSEARTLQEFAERYPCTDAQSCPKVENITTRVAIIEGAARLYVRRPWPLRPYLAAGAQVMRIQDIPDAYQDFSYSDFPSAYDSFPALWTAGVTMTPGFTIEVGPGAHFYGEVPLYGRLVTNAYDALHYYAETPMVEEPEQPFSLPFVASIRVGLHVRLF